jgi:uncharacterized protein YdaU (DUF1376 family)
MADDLFNYWFKWYPARFRKKTLHLSLIQRAIYRDLIDFYMETRAPLPDSDMALARIVGISVEEFAPHSAQIRVFFRARKGQLFHSFCEGILRDQEEANKIRQEKASKGGKARAEKNKQKQEASSSKQTASNAPSLLGSARVEESRVEEKKKGTRTSIPLTDKSVPKTHIPLAAPEGVCVFDDFWKERPGREGTDPQDPAQREFERLVGGGTDPALLVKAMKAYAAEMRSKDLAGTRYTKSAAGFLRDGAWEKYAGQQPQPETPTVAVAPLPDWQKPFVKFSSETEVRNWLKGAAIDGKRISVRSEFTAKEVRKRFDQAFRTVLGEGFEVIVESSKQGDA